MNSQQQSERLTLCHLSKVYSSYHSFRIEGPVYKGIAFQARIRGWIYIQRETSAMTRYLHTPVKITKDLMNNSNDTYSLIQSFGHQTADPSAEIVPYIPKKLFKRNMWLLEEHRDSAVLTVAIGRMNFLSCQFFHSLIVFLLSCSSPFP